MPEERRGHNLETISSGEIARFAAENAGAEIH
jgi:hypothetical protein